jgi:hypothetical protein
MALHPLFQSITDLHRRGPIDPPLPLLTITAPDGKEKVRGRLDDALWAKVWGKLEVGGVSEAPVLERGDLSDWIDFHVAPLVVTPDRYLEGAARWAARQQKAAA